MLRIIYSLTLCLLLIAPVASQASNDIAVLNLQRIMRDSLAAKSLRDKLESKQASFKQEMITKEQSLQEKERTLAQQKAVIAPGEFEKKVKAFRVEATQAQREVQEKKAKLDKAFAEALEEVQVAIKSIVKDMAKEQQFKAVFPTSQLLYVDPAMDITEPVLAKLNSKLPTLKVKF
jgi:Skp family chaperone for outer membrane proteins